jgi:hypothetical protein
MTDKRIQIVARLWSQAVQQSGHFDLLPESLTDSLADREQNTTYTDQDCIPSLSEDIGSYHDPLLSVLCDDIYIPFQVCHRRPRYQQILPYLNRLRFKAYDPTNVSLDLGLRHVQKHKLDQMVIKPNTWMTWNEHRLYEDEYGYEHELAFDMSLYEAEMIVVDLFRKCGYPENLLCNSFYHPKEPEKIFYPNKIFRWFGPALDQPREKMFLLCLITEHLFCLDRTTNRLTVAVSKPRKSKTLSTFSAVCLISQ